MIGYRCGFNTDEELEVAFDLATASAAKALRLSGYGLHTGAAADFVVLDAEHIPEAVVSAPGKRSVYKRGRLVAADGEFRGANSMLSRL
jgi:cytosine deaminase